MARSRGPNEASSYEGLPAVPPTLARRYALVTTALSGATTISAAATELGMARVNMQTLVHRAQAAIVSALQPRRRGRKPMPAREQALRTELARVRARQRTLQARLTAMEGIVDATGGIIRELRGRPPRTTKGSSTRSKRSPAAAASSEEPPGCAPPTAASPSTPPGPPPAASPSPPTERATAAPPTEPLLAASPTTAAWTSTSTSTTLADATLAAVARVAPMRAHRARAARAFDAQAPTLRRWITRQAAGEPLQRRRGGCRAPVSPAEERRVREQVRALHGLVGARSLGRATGVSRRNASDIKRDEVAAMERERVAACERVEVIAPGVVRGFDAMHTGDTFVLIAADAAVPQRTSIVEVPRYDAEHVARVLAADFERHGAPLVLRSDRARCHDAPAVVSVLEAYGVLSLHGPPHHPGYYGQLERQNREHRAWLATARDVSPATLEQMRLSLNGAWHRPTLDWHTADELWCARKPLTDDRDELREWVLHRTARLCDHGLTVDLATRLAIEQALITRGYLTITPRASLLCE